MSTFTADSVGDQSGKTFVITGGNSGIGFEAARVLLARGGHVVLACRDAGKMNDAKARLLAEHKNAKVDEVVLDLGSFEKIASAAKQLADRFEHIDVLVNNAGVMAIPFRESADGIEMQMATNHFGPFALTGHLLPKLLSTPNARVVTVSSLLHSRGHMVWQDIPKPAQYDASRAYAMSKLANVLFAKELDRRAKKAKTSLVSAACHPGYSATNLQFVGPAMEGSGFRRTMMKISNAVIAQSADRGALGTLYASTQADVKGGEYIGPTGFFNMRGAPVKATPIAEAEDPAVAAKLWSLSEELTKVSYVFG
jgi:NAD(P)-dependent dehydrogenase (short-subunit alcohol dehydrogenase family)